MCVPPKMLIRASPYSAPAEFDRRKIDFSLCIFRISANPSRERIALVYDVEVKTFVQSAMLFLLVTTAPPLYAEKPAKIPVAFGAWKGPHAGTFKSGLRRGLAKGCAVVGKNKARVIIEGEVTEQENKHFSLRVVVKSPRGDGDIIE